MLRTITIAAALALSAPSALGQVLILGGGFAEDCYKMAETARTAPLRAAEVCTEALEKQVMDRDARAGTHVNRGVLLMRGGEYDGAFADFDRALELRPGLAEAYLNRGAASIYTRDFATALGDLDKAIMLQSRDLFAAHYNRAIARENTGDVAGAYADFKTALELRPGWALASQQLERFSVTTR